MPTQSKSVDLIATNWSINDFQLRQFDRLNWESVRDRVSEGGRRRLSATAHEIVSNPYAEVAGGAGGNRRQVHYQLHSRTRNLALRDSRVV